jgi:LCP family protein required for cell wall assembly
MRQAFRPTRRRVVLGVILLLALLAAYPLTLATTAWNHLARVVALPATGLAATPGTNFLVVGSDGRTGLTAAQRQRLHTGLAVGQRTDTIMLLHVPTSGTPTLISLPRDSYVPIPGHSKNKINAAYAFGGATLLLGTVEGATGVHIDGYVETGMLGFADLVDAVGGVNICVKRAMNDQKSGLHVKQGCQDFDGTTALAYARDRYSDPLGDLGRVQRQRQVMSAIATKALAPSTLANPFAAFSAAAAGGKALAVDNDLSPALLAKFVLAMRDVAGGKGTSTTVPIATAALSTPAGLAVKWDTAKARALFASLA